MYQGGPSIRASARTGATRSSHPRFRKGFLFPARAAEAGEASSDRLCSPDTCTAHTEEGAGSTGRAHRPDKEAGQRRPCFGCAVRRARLGRDVCQPGHGDPFTPGSPELQDPTSHRSVPSWRFFSLLSRDTEVLRRHHQATGETLVPLV